MTATSKKRWRDPAKRDPFTVDHPLRRQTEEMSLIHPFKVLDHHGGGGGGKREGCASENGELVAEKTRGWR